FDCDLPRPALDKARFERYNYRHDDGENNRERDPQPMGPAEAHEPPPWVTTSIFKWSRVSSSHLLERSLMARWISTSRMVSLTSSNDGTGSPRALSCDANSSR